MLQHDAGVRAHLRAVGGWVVAEHAHLTVAGARQPLHHFEGGGFAGAVGAEQAVDLAGGDGEADLVDCGEVVVAALQPVNLNCVFHASNTAGIVLWLVEAIVTNRR